MSPRVVDWIWHVRGSLALAPGQSGSDALDRLAPLFRQTGTSAERSLDTLTFRKSNQAAQDKMSIFDRGVLKIEQDVAGLVLRYQLVSHALLLCFVAPLFFLSIAQLTKEMVKFEKSSTHVSENVQDTKLKSKGKDKALPLNPIDKALGAPAPEPPNKGKENKKTGRDKRPSPTAAYVFSGIFLSLYVAGRLLENVLVKRLFKAALFSTRVVESDTSVFQRENVSTM